MSLANRVRGVQSAAGHTESTGVAASVASANESSNAGSTASSRSRSADSAVLSRVGSQTVLRATRDVLPISPGRSSRAPLSPAGAEAMDAAAGLQHHPSIADALPPVSDAVETPPQLQLGLVLSNDDVSRGGSRPQSSLRYSESATTPMSARRSSPRLLAPVVQLGGGGTPLAAGGGPQSHAQHPLWSLPHTIMRQTSFNTPMAASSSREVSVGAEELLAPQPVYGSSVADGAAPPATHLAEVAAIDEDFGDFLEDTIRVPDAAVATEHAATDPIDAPFTEVTIALPPPDAQAAAVTGGGGPHGGGAGGAVVVGSPKRRSDAHDVQRRDAAAHERQEVQLRMAASANGHAFVATGLFCHLCGAQADSALELRLHWLLCQEKTDALIDTLVAHPLCSVMAYPTHPLQGKVMAGTLCLETELLAYNTRALAVLEDATCWCRGCGTGHALHRMLAHLQRACPRHLKGMPECPLDAPHHLTCTEQDEADAAEEHVLIGRLSEAQNHRIVLGQFDWRATARSASPVCVRPKQRASLPRSSATPRRSVSPRAWRQ